jgi:hypothetical protein
LSLQPRVSPRLLSIAAALLLLLVIVSVLRREPPPPKLVVVPKTPPRLDADLSAVWLSFLPSLLTNVNDVPKYAGSKTCGGCHPRETKEHAGSGHALTLKPVDPQRERKYFRLGVVLNDVRRGIKYHPEVHDGRLLIRHEGLKSPKTVSVDLALGAGANGQAFLSVHEDGSGLLCRTALVKRKGKMVWAWHPGLQPEKELPAPEGTPLHQTAFTMCISCHSTTMTMRYNADTARLGIGCERCHGPAQEHLTAVGKDLAGVKAGTVASGMPSIGKLSSVEELALCNTCHRPLGTLKADGEADDMVRGQPLLLQRSRCYKESGGKLRCSTCHNPHTNAEHSQAHYRTVCMSCHTPAKPEQRPCPVQPRGDCVSCHMSNDRISIFANVDFTNHWIRRRPKNELR